MSLNDTEMVAAVVDDPRPLDARRVLVHGNDFRIGEDVAGLVGHVPDVVARNEGCGHDRPHAEVGSGLGVRQAGVAHLEHVRVVPMPRPRVLSRLIVLVDDLVDVPVPLAATAETRADVKRASPQMTGRNHPRPFEVPGADAEHNRAACGCQRR